MALLLDGNMALKSAVTNYASRPFTFGMWINTPGGSLGFPFIAHNFGGDEVLALVDDEAAALGTASAFCLYEVGAAASETQIVPLVRTKNVWLFVLCRAISATNRRLSILDASTGAVTHASGTTSITQPATDRMLIGAYEIGGSFGGAFTGSIAEFWYTNIDAQVGGGQVDETLMRHLAYGGPFSVPHVGQAVREYRSFRAFGPSSKDDPSEVFAGNGLGPQTWAEFGSSNCAIGPHPSLPYWYVKPNQNLRNLTV